MPTRRKPKPSYLTVTVPREYRISVETLRREFKFEHEDILSSAKLNLDEGCGYIAGAATRADNATAITLLEAYTFERFMRERFRKTFLDTVQSDNLDPSNDADLSQYVTDEMDSLWGDLLRTAKRKRLARKRKLAARKK
jgi:hypothetical protein